MDAGSRAWAAATRNCVRDFLARPVPLSKAAAKTLTIEVSVLLSHRLETAVQLLKKLGADAGQIQGSKLRSGYDGALNVFSVAPG